MYALPPVSATQSSSGSGPQYRFGPFEADVSRGELRKFGLRIRLERKPLQLLLCLLRRPAEVVTREELRSELWAEDVFVDFDHGLNVAVKKLRAALCDSADAPEYIETIAGKGYRFVASVEHVFASDLRSASERNPETKSALPPPTPAEDRFAGPQMSTSWHRDWIGFHRRSAAGVAAVLAGLVLLTIASVKLVHRLRGPAQGPETKIMLVVLPFENLSSDPSLEYLGDGITEELSEHLGNLSPQRLGVIGRTSAMAFKHSTQTIKEIGKELGVGYVLEGSVRPEGDKLRITAQLVRVSDQAHVWAADYDRNMRGLVQVEDDVARQITEHVGVSVAAVAPNKLNQHTSDPEAHRAYLLARYYWNKRTPAGAAIAEQYFRRAINIDPKYAAAYAGLAECTPMPEAKAAALKAVELDPSSGEARTSLGFIELFREVDVPAAERTLKIAIELDPNYATAHHWYAFVLKLTDRSSESLSEITEAAKLDPLSLIIRSTLAGALSNAGQDDTAQAQLKLVFDMDPNYPKAHEVLGEIDERKGMYEAAIHEYELSAQNGGDPLWADRGYVYAISGHKQEALNVLARLQEQEKHDEALSFDLALVNIGLGRKEEAIAWLQKYSQRPDDGWLWVRSNPRFDPLRSDPRFQALLHRMKVL